MSPSATDRKKLLLLIAGLGAAAVALFVVNRQLDAFLYAWDNGSSGRPTLSGAWVGRSYAMSAAAPNAIGLAVSREIGTPRPSTWVCLRQSSPRLTGSS